jgi:predicted DNA-binding ribbon-helix-helix protein
MRKLEHPRDVTTVLLEKDTVKDLKHIARKDQTYDQLIKELLNLKGIKAVK